MSIFKHDKNLKQIATELEKIDINICKDAANLKELQKKHPGLKQICENYNNFKKVKENHIVNLLEYLENISDNTLSNTAVPQLNLEKKNIK